MRIGFLDEAGRSRHEPTLVVAGVVVHGDRDYRRIRDHLKEIAKRHIPELERDGFLFHASDIFHGSGKFFHRRRDEWPPPRRFAILRELAAIPAKFSLPIVFGNVKKPHHTQIVQRVVDAVKAPRHRHQYVIDLALHGAAFAMAETAVEMQLQKFPRNEIAMLVAEDTDSVKPAILFGHKLLQNPQELAQIYPKFPNYDLPVTRIVEGPFFKAKADSPPLQVADTCAFILCHRLNRDQRTQEFFELLSSQLTMTTADFGEPMGAEKIGGGQRI